MKIMSAFLLLAITAIAGCSTAANNGNNANIRGTNTNTGYVTNSETNVKPAMPTNATNISPPSMNTGNGNHNGNGNMNGNRNSNMNSNSNSNARK